MKFRKKLKQYVLQEFHNPKDIIVLVRDMKNPSTILNKSSPTALSTENGKYPIVVMIHMEQIKQYFKKGPTLRQSRNKLYGLILGQCYPDLHRKWKATNTTSHTHQRMTACGY